MNLTGKLAAFYKGRRRELWVIALIVPPLILVLGLVLYPQLFWDGFLYKYFWGPVVADRYGGFYDGISEGYNSVSTLTYALLLGLGIALFYRIFKRLHIRVDLTLVLATLPLFIFGGTARALEDTALFKGWEAYLFISPLIYFLIITIFLVCVLVGYFLRDRTAWSPRRKTAVFSLLIFSLAFLDLAIIMSSPTDFSCQLDPLVVLAFAAAICFLFFLLLDRQVDEVNLTIFGVGLFFLSISVAYLAEFSYDPSWQDYFVLVNHRLIEAQSWEIVIIPTLALVITALVFLMGKSLRLAALTLSANVLLLFSHFLDGSATYRGMELYGYSEKHVLPNILIAATGTPLVMLLLKFLMVGAVIYLIDVLFREDLKRYPNASMLLKFVVIFLGLAPGVRDMVRIALGV